MWFLDSKSSLRFDSNLDFESKIHVLSRLVQYVLLLTEVIIAPGFIKKLNIKHYPVIVCLWLTTTQGKINFSWFRQDLWFFHGIHTLFHHKFFWWRSSQLDPGQLTVADDPHIISADNFDFLFSPLFCFSLNRHYDIFSICLLVLWASCN